MGAPRGRLALVRRQLWPAAYPDRGGQNYTVRVTRAYLDHAATAPLRPEAGEEFLRVARELGNPNAIHTFGRNARRYLDEAREEVAGLLGAEPAEVIFTSGGTEADNLAVQGGWVAASGNARASSSPRWSTRRSSKPPIGSAPSTGRSSTSHQS